MTDNKLPLLASFAAGMATVALFNKLVAQKKIDRTHGKCLTRGCVVVVFILPWQFSSDESVSLLGHLVWALLCVCSHFVFDFVLFIPSFIYSFLN